MFINMVNLGDQPDAGAKQHGAQQVKSFAGGLVPAIRPPEPITGAMGADQCRQNDPQFYKLVHPLPVVGKQQDDAQPEEDGTDAEENDPAPGDAFGRRRISIFECCRLARFDDALIYPQIDFAEQPFDVLFYDGPFDFSLPVGKPACLPRPRG